MRAGRITFTADELPIAHAVDAPRQTAVAIPFGANELFPEDQDVEAPRNNGTTPSSTLGRWSERRNGQVHASGLVIDRERARSRFCLHLLHERVGVGGILMENRKRSASTTTRHIDPLGRGIKFQRIDSRSNR